MKRVCKQCGKEFEMTQHEIQFYKKKKLSLPKRCRACREKNKEAKKTGPDKEESRSTVSQGTNSMEKTPSTRREPLQKKRETAANRIGLIAALFLVICSAVAGINPFSSDSQEPADKANVISAEELEFRSEKLLEEHFEKHGMEMGFISAEEYEDAAAEVVANSEVLHKTEKEDGDDVYYLEETNEFVVVSTDGYIRTYFEPEDGMEYFERQ